MNINATKTILEKDIDKLNNEYAKGKLYAHAIVKEQEALLKRSEEHQKELKVRQLSLRASLRKYVEGQRELDNQYYELKDEYVAVTNGLTSVEKAINICVESLEEYKMGV